MSWLARYTRSSIGAKHVMAVTGLGLLLFASLHMLGHLQMFGGRETYNSYASWLQGRWEVKWPIRAGLLGALSIHIVVAAALVANNRAARPIRYAIYRPQRATWFGRSMALSGAVVLAFLIVHIIHFTISPSHPGDAYAMYVHAFRQPWYYAVYLAGMLVLAVHLGHGAASWLQSLGLRHPKYPTDKLGPILSVGLFAGYMVPPTAVLAGILT